MIKLLKKKVKIERNDTSVVAEASGNIRKIFSEIKEESYSNFEKVKNEVSLMLMQPDKI